MTGEQYWRQRYEMLMATVSDIIKNSANPPMKMLADAESFEAGKAMAFNGAKYSIGIDTSDGVHTVVVSRLMPNQPTVVVATERLPSASKQPVFSGAICAKCKINRLEQPCHTPSACGFVGVAQ